MSDQGSPLARFAITVRPGGAQVIVNDEDVSARVRSFAVHQGEQGMVPALVLDTFAEGTIEGEGVVQVPDRGPVDTGPAVIAFLRAMDPGEVERKALEGLSMGDKIGAAEMIIRQLIREAGGEP